MTAFLHRLPIARKFWLILALPLLALAWFATSGALDRQRLAANLDDLVRLTTVSRQAGDLIHAVQLERGLSAGYLGSEGRRFGDRLETQRPETDARHAAFEASLTGLETQGLAPTLRHHLDELDRLLADIPDLRRRVDGLTIAADEAMARYTAVNAELMAMVGRLAHAAEDPNIARTLGAYASLLQAKDLAGIERAWLANAFAADGMSAPAYQRLLTLLGRQAAFLQAFRTQADDDLITRLDQALEDPQVAHLETLRRLVMQRGTDGDYGIDPQEWFDGQTGKIEDLKAVEDSVAARVLAGADALREAASRAFWQYLAIALLSAMLALGLSRLIVRSILGPLNANLTAIRERGGDLTRQLTVPGSDELSRLYQAFNTATEETASLVGHIRRSALSVEVAGGEIAQGNQDLAQRTEEQSASQVETASSLDQIAAAVRQTADHAHQADDMTQDVAEQADEARRVAVEAGDAMRLIQTANQEVTRIIGAIDSIAFQTNLLALNASVEAARAGEQGRGFAVVAGEVRQLASRSAEEAAQIRRRIDTNVERINAGQALVDATGQALETIARRVRDLASLVGEMSATTQEQAAGVAQINQAMSQLEDVTQQNAGLVEQVAAASRSLDEQAGEMTALIGRFRVPEGARIPPAPAPATPPHDGPLLLQA